MKLWLTRRIVNPIDMLHVYRNVRVKRNVEGSGGLYYITSLLTQGFSSAAHLIYHSQIIVQEVPRP